MSILRRGRRTVAMIAVAAVALLGTTLPAEAKKDTLEVVAFDFGFTLPDIEAGKFKLELTNIGEHPHLIAIAEAPAGVTAEEVIADESLIIRDVGFAFAEPPRDRKGQAQGADSRQLRVRLLRRDA